MKYPTLRYPRLCRLLTYVVVLGAFLLPVLIVLNLSFIPSIIKIIVFFGCFCALLGYLFREFPVLMMLDISLAFLSCYHTARTQYKLRAHNTVLRTERTVSRYGTKCTPVALLPQPTDLRYQFSSPWTIFSRGIERVVAAYHTDVLDTETYRTIFSSALTNSKSLVGHKKARFLDRQQKKAALHRVTVIIIYAKQVAPQLAGNLYELVCKQSGNDFESSVLPCVVDLSRGICTFNSLRVPYVGFSYAVKNRGIRLIRRLILDGVFPLADNHYYLPQKDPISPDQSLWEFWKSVRMESGVTQPKTMKKLQEMADQEILLEEKFLYIKWGTQGIRLAAEEHPKTKTITLEQIESWSYPEVRPIAKKTVLAIKQEINRHYEESGWSIVYRTVSERR